MKISNAAAEPFSAIRRRALAQAGAQAAPTAAAVDTSAFLGLEPADMTPAVRAALQTLITELDDLKREVSRLKAQLAEAEEMADRDPLTPVKNRRAFAREVQRTSNFLRRYGGAASVVYFDLDGFKSVNDRFGHAAGDAALCAVAERLASNVRESDVVGRMGGDEFAVVLTRADRVTAEAKAEALAALVEREPVQCGEWSVPLHISYGVREITPEADAEIVIAEADAVMFVSKQARVAVGAR